MGSNLTKAKAYLVLELLPIFGHMLYLPPSTRTRHHLGYFHQNWYDSIEISRGQNNSIGTYVKTRRYQTIHPKKGHSSSSKARDSYSELHMLLTPAVVDSDVILVDSVLMEMV